MRTIAIDFDGVIRDGNNKSYPGVRDAISRLREAGHRIILHSCNNTDFIEKWMFEQDIRYDGIWGKAGKPVATVYIDDRGYHFRNWDETLLDMELLLK